MLINAMPIRTNEPVFQKVLFIWTLVHVVAAVRFLEMRSCSGLSHAIITLFYLTVIAITYLKEGSWFS